MPKSKSDKPRGRGRPPVNPPDFTERFMIRATPDDLERWRAAAMKAGLAVGPWIRTLANRAAPSPQVK